MAPSDPGNNKALLQHLQGDLRHLAPILEQVVGVLRTVQSSIDEDKRTAVASATVRHEVQVASTLSTAQAMLAGLGIERLCSALGNVNLAPADRPVWSWWSALTNQCAELVGHCSIRSRACDGPL